VKAAGDARQVSLLAPDAAEFLHLLRQLTCLTGALAERYEVALGPTGPVGPTIQSPADVAAYLGPEMARLAQEQLRVVLLDTKNHVTGAVLVYQGGANQTVVRVADCFREAVRSGATAIVLCHNHPSGDATPSPEDVKLTRDVGRAGELLDVEVVDHVIVAAGGHRAAAAPRAPIWR
jgi:DNA repair protein RadC